MNRPDPGVIEFAWKVIENEGLAYALLHYFGRNVDEDYGLPDELIMMWHTAYDALKPLNDYLVELTDNFEVEE